MLCGVCVRAWVWVGGRVGVCVLAFVCVCFPCVVLSGEWIVMHSDLARTLKAVQVSIFPLVFSRITRILARLLTAGDAMSGGKLQDEHTQEVPAEGVVRVCESGRERKKPMHEEGNVAPCCFHLFNLREVAQPSGLAHRSR